MERKLKGEWTHKAVDETDFVDFVTEAADGTCHLIVSDHLDWEGREDHARMLQDKLNRYLASVDSGELIEKFPTMAGRNIVIGVRFLYAPSDFGLKFLSLVQGTIEGLGFRFEWKMSRTQVH